MDRETACSRLEDAKEHFSIEGEIIECRPYGNGHINDTYMLRAGQKGAEQRYILQRINHEIFKKPVEVMENIYGVTSYLKEEIKRQGGDPERETLSIIKTRDGKLLYEDGIGCYWRMYRYIENTVCYESATPELFYESAVSFGNFQSLLSGYPAGSLHETIVNFHHTVSRFSDFKSALKEDRENRAKEAQDEISFVLEREHIMGKLLDLQQSGQLPTRVSHNDTKLNNILFDKDSNKGICIIDLDTIMPGLAAYDFGDSIRFGASTAAEDEKDLSKVHFDKKLYDSYLEGYLKGCQGKLTEKEVETLPWGAILMTQECGMRFLADFLAGDVYFKTERREHNLDRCRTQFRLVQEMEEQLL